MDQAEVQESAERQHQQHLQVAHTQMQRDEGQVVRVERLVQLADKEQLELVEAELPRTLLAVFEALLGAVLHPAVAALRAAVAPAAEPA